jgi:amidase
VTKFGLGLETSCVGCLTNPEMPYLPTLTKFGAYEFQQVFNRYLETLDSSQVSNLKELVDWNHQHADRELPKGARTR